MSFASDMRRIANKIGADMETTGKAVKIEVFRRAILGTRVHTGRARGNWQTTEDSPSTSTLERFDPSGDKALSDTQNASGIGVTYLTNNLPYIGKLEELDGMVVSAVADVRRILKRA